MTDRLKACALCDKTINESTDSTEHLILNAIGGRRKVHGVLCVNCNSEAGMSWDSALAEQLNPLSLLLGIKRHRGTVPSQAFETLSGGTLELHHDGSMNPADPVYRELSTAEGAVTIQIVARTMREARQMLRGAKRKYPKLDVDELLQTIRPEIVYPTEPMKLSLSYGGAVAGRSMVKSALCFATALGADPKACTDGRAYLANQHGEPCFGYYYARDLVSDRPKGVPFHCVAASNRGADGQLLAYIEFFGAQRAVICLARQYDGPDIHCSYAIDPCSGEELNIDIDLRLSREEIVATYAYERIPPGSIEAAFKDILETALSRSHERERNRVLSEAAAYAWKNCGATEGETLTAEHLDTIARLLIDKLDSYLRHQLVGRRRRE